MGRGINWLKPVGLAKNNAHPTGVIHLKQSIIFLIYISTKGIGKHLSVA